MSHIPYTLFRSGTYYYNRRVPKHAVKAYGPFIRQVLSKCPEEAEAYAKRLGDVLEGSWSNTTSIQPVDIPTILFSFKPRSFQLSEIAEEYLSLRAIDEKPPRVALSGFISLAGDRDSASTLERMPSCLSVIWKLKVIRLPLSEDVSTACLLF